MHFIRTLSQLAVFASAACAAVVASTEPKLDVSASFASDNPFGQVVNGQKTTLNIKILNSSGANVTLVDIAGSFHDVDSGKTLRNITSRKFNMPIIEGMNLTFPYYINSELRPKDTKLLVWANVNDGTNTYRLTAYDSIVAVVEPPSSIFDIQMILTYLTLIGLIGGGGYFAYQTMNPPPKKSRSAKPDVPATQVPLPETPGGAARYEEEWIPSHHLGGTGARARKVSRGEALSSGDESASGAGKKKKGGKGR